MVCFISKTIGQLKFVFDHSFLKRSLQTFCGGATSSNHNLNDGFSINPVAQDLFLQKLSRKISFQCKKKQISVYGEQFCSRRPLTN